jgi:Protein of unknown function (DUF4256)
MIKNSANKILSSTETVELLGILKNRFEQNTSRHSGLNWRDVEEKLLAKPDKLSSLNEMEKTGGQPDVVNYNKQTEEYIFYDCSPETPDGRRSLCYDPNSLNSRKTFKPAHSAEGLAEEMGIELLNEEEYNFLQSLGNFDTKTSSWLKTPDNIRKLGGGIFGDWRFGRVFVYHNGVESYYSSRGFRGLLRV